MLPEKVVNALNDHIGLEMFATQAYRSIVNEACKRWPGFEHWAKCRVKREFKRWREVQSYMNDRGVTPTLNEAQKPAKVGDGPQSFATMALGLEQHLLDHLLLIAGLGDKQTEEFVESYYTARMKNIAKLKVLLERIKLAGNDMAALQAIDRKVHP